MGVKKTSLYSLIKKGLFPKPRRLMANSRSVGWLEEEVDNYVAGLGVQQSASPKAHVVQPAKEAVRSAPSRTLRIPAKATNISKNHGDKAAAPDDVLVPIGLEIMGRPVFLHKKSGKVLLDIGNMSLPLIGNSVKETLTAR